jgi:hypothetical protein
MMSLTYFAIRWAQLDQQINAAGRAGDICGMQPLLAEQTLLLTAMCGRARDSPQRPARTVLRRAIHQFHWHESSGAIPIPALAVFAAEHD